MITKLRTALAAAGAAYTNPQDFATALTHVKNSGKTYNLSELRSWDSLAGLLDMEQLTPGQAMKHTTVFACQQRVSQALSVVDLAMYDNLGAGQKQRNWEHPLNMILSMRPNPKQSASVFWSRVFGESQQHGAGYAWIQRNRNGDPLGLWHIPFLRVQKWLNGDNTGYIYRITFENGETMTVYQDDILEIPGSSVWMNNRPLSPLQAALISADVSGKGRKFLQQFLKNNAQPGGYIKFPENVDVPEELSDAMREQWKEKFTGDKVGQIAVLSEGAEYHPLTISAADAQLIEIFNMSKEDIATAYGVPMSLINAMQKVSNWGTGVEQQFIGFIQLTLLPLATYAEQEIWFKVIRNAKNKCNFELDTLMRGDSKARSEYYRKALGGSSGPGWMTPNEVRSSPGVNLPRHEDPDADKLTKWTGVGNPNTNQSDKDDDDDNKGEEE